MAVSYTIAKEPFYIDYIQDRDSNEPNQKTIQLLYNLSTEAQESIGVLRILNRILLSEYDRNLYEWLDSSIEIDDGVIHFLSTEYKIKPNQWMHYNLENVVYQGTGYGSLLGINYNIVIIFKEGKPHLLQISTVYD